MTIVANTRRITAACAALAALLICAKAAQPLKLDFSEDTVGAEPKAFLSVVGVWRIEAEKNNKVLAVDGRQWKEGQTSAGTSPTRRAPSTATATPSSSTGSRPMHTSPTSWPGT